MALLRAVDVAGIERLPHPSNDVTQRAASPGPMGEPALKPTYGPLPARSGVATPDTTARLRLRSSPSEAILVGVRPRHRGGAFEAQSAALPRPGGWAGDVRVRSTLVQATLRPAKAHPKPAAVNVAFRTTSHRRVLLPSAFERAEDLAPRRHSITHVAGNHRGVVDHRHGGDEAVHPQA